MYCDLLQFCHWIIVVNLDFKTLFTFVSSYIIWCGDLNFRLEENSFNFDQIVEAVQRNELGSKHS